MEDRFLAFEDYSFSQDQVYEEGVKKSKNLTDCLETRHFYYSKKYEFSSFLLSDYEEWKKKKKSLPTTTLTPNSLTLTSLPTTTLTPHSLTFPQIMDRVSRGLEIEGIKQIPSTTHNHSSKALLTPRRKPWEEK
jgi:hypothetical protein